MAIRNIREIGDPVLNKSCKVVKEVTDRTRELIEDMFDTMYEAQGVGLAAPQVGILKRIVTIDVTGGSYFAGESYDPGNQRGTDGKRGCLSVPGKTGVVTRPNYVKVRAYDRNLEPFELEGTELLARAICHEVEHLDGHLYVEKVEGELMNVSDLEDEED